MCINFLCCNSSRPHGKSGCRKALKNRLNFRPETGLGGLGFALPIFDTFVFISRLGKVKRPQGRLASRFRRRSSSATPCGVPPTPLFPAWHLPVTCPPPTHRTRKGAKPGG